MDVETEEESVNNLKMMSTPALFVAYGQTLEKISEGHRELTALATEMERKQGVVKAHVVDRDELARELAVRGHTCACDPARTVPVGSGR